MASVLLSFKTRSFGGGWSMSESDECMAVYSLQASFELAGFSLFMRGPRRDEMPLASYDHGAINGPTRLFNPVYS